MTDKASDVAALGGSRPAETGPGANGAVPTGGGKAVPDDKFLMGGTGSPGDNDSLDDGALGSIKTGANSGDSVAEEAAAVAGPKVAPTENTASPDEGNAPTGGLSGSGTVGSTPTGTLQPGVSDKSS